MPTGALKGKYQSFVTYCLKCVFCQPTETFSAMYVEAGALQTTHPPMLSSAPPPTPPPPPMSS